MGDERSLATLKRLTIRRAHATEAWRKGVREAISYGNSHRDVAEAAGISHTRVQQIIRDE